MVIKKFTDIDKARFFDACIDELPKIISRLHEQFASPFNRRISVHIRHCAHHFKNAPVSAQNRRGASNGSLHEGFVDKAKIIKLTIRHFRTKLQLINCKSCNQLSIIPSRMFLYFGRQRHCAHRFKNAPVSAQNRRGASNGGLHEGFVDKAKIIKLTIRHFRTKLRFINCKSCDNPQIQKNLEPQELRFMNIIRNLWIFNVLAKSDISACKTRRLRASQTTSAITAISAFRAANVTPQGIS